MMLLPKLDQAPLAEGGRRLRALRKGLDLTQMELAAIIGCERTVITKYETEGRAPELATMIALSDFFQVPVDFLLGKSMGDAEKATESARERALLAALRGIPEKERRAYERMLFGRAALGKPDNDPAA